MSTTVKVINSVTALGADCTVTANGFVTIAGQEFKSSDVLDYKITPYVADTAQVHTSTTTATASTNYQIMISCQNRNQGNEWQTFLSPVITSAATTSKTAINTYLYNWVNSMRNGGNGPMTVTATLSGGSPNDELVLTGDTYYPEFTVAVIAGPIVFADTTPGVVGSGSGAKIDAVGQYLPEADDSVQIVTTNNYSTVEVKINSQSFNGSGTTAVPDLFVLYVNEGDTDYPTLIGYNSTLGIGYGTLASVLVNNRKATYSAVGANVAVASLVATRASGSFFTENIKGGDLFLIGTTPALINVPYTDGATATDLAFTKATVTGSDVSSAAASLVKFTSLP